MTNPELTFLESLVQYINEKLYRLEIELQPGSHQRETVVGLRSLTNAVTVLLEQGQNER